MRNFWILIVSAVNICKHCLQTASVSGSFSQTPRRASPLKPTGYFCPHPPYETSWGRHWRALSLRCISLSRQVGRRVMVDCLEVKSEYYQNSSVLDCGLHNVHSQQHTFVSSSYRSNRLGLSYWDSYAMCRGGCLELYYCNMVEWFWWDSSLIFDDQVVSFSALTLLVWSSGL